MKERRIELRTSLRCQLELWLSSTCLACSYSMLILGGVIIVRLHIKKEVTTFEHRQCCWRGPAMLQLNRAIEKPRYCRSQHSGWPRLNAIIGRLHAMPQVLPATHSLADARASSHHSNELSSTASHNPGISLSVTYTKNAGSAADQSASLFTAALFLS
jgi:hypothetical protein